MNNSITDWASVFVSAGTFFLLWWTLVIQIKLEKKQHIFFKNEAKKWRLSMLPDFRIVQSTMEFRLFDNNYGLFFEVEVINNKALNCSYSIKSLDSSYTNVNTIDYKRNYNPNDRFDIVTYPINKMDVFQQGIKSAIKGDFEILIAYEDIAGNSYVKQIEYINYPKANYSRQFNDHSPEYLSS